MKRRLLMTLSGTALTALLVMPVLFLCRILDHAAVIWWLNLATLGWFATAPLWMGKNRDS